MSEKIGGVLIDDRFYPGEDLYTDGPVEKELLEIAGKYTEDELNRVIAEKKDWAVMYHFSHLRQNICEWIPIRRTDRVLEIGSGCGAVTGMLAQKAKKVTCAELSMVRSRINAARNRSYDNIEILVGNFLDIEKSLDETFDYITLIGVFEYSKGFMGEEEPYRKMLELVMRHLAPGGRLVLAIENKLGMKYWAGCTEDHTGRLFDGIEGYPGEEAVRTFSRSELLALLHEAGFCHTDFYYPYPDYKFPMTIYSDSFLPQKGELNGFFPNFDRSRLALFSEPKAYDSIIEAGLFPEFSNSFLVLAGKEEA